MSRVETRNDDKSISHSFVVLILSSQCLTAYNCFFREERQRLLAQLPTRAHVKSKKAHGKISFENLGKTISRNWKKITPEQKKYYKELAAKDKQRYLDQMEEWRALLAERENEANQSSSPHAIDTPLVIRGSVLMDNSVVSPVESQDLSHIVSDVHYDNTIDPVYAVDAIDEQDIMYTMPTEELMELAVTGTSVFTFDNPSSNPSTVSLDSETSRSDSEAFETPNLEHYLDTDCKDFLVSAFT